MTEKQWLACKDPVRMLKFLQRSASERKLRLFALACCRRAEHLPYRGLPAEESEKARARDRHALAVAGRFAEGEASRAELATALRSAWTNSAGRACTRSSAFLAAEQSVNHVRWVVHWHPGTKRAEKAREPAAQAELLRDIFRPFRPVSIAPVWRTPQVAALAQAAYGERALPAGTLDPARLAVLADALEDVGCYDADLLGHLRGPGPHVRGCWAVDLLLGRG